MQKRIFIITIIAIFFLCNLSKSNAQVTINPMFILIDKNTKNAVLEVKNPSNEVIEVKLEFKFSYPKYDSTGHWKLFDDTVMAKKYSLDPYIKIFPKKLIVPPNESQTVRVMLKNLPDTGDLSYWTRIEATSDPIIKQIDSTSKSIKIDSGKVRASIILKSKLIGLVMYHQGNVTSSIDFNIFRYYADSSKFHLICKVEKSGTSPFLGSYILKAYDINDNLIIEKNDKVAYYESSDVEFLLSTTELIRGKIKIELTINNEKPDLAEELRIPFKPVTKIFYVDY